MKKLKLNLDDLKVESFTTTPESQRESGTVIGQVTLFNTCYTNCWQTCGLSCGCGTVGATDCPEETNGCCTETMEYPTCTDEGCTFCGEMC